MKEKIKTNDFEKISAGVLFIKDNKILLCHVTGRNHWDLPKGQRNENEDFIDAAIRECQEETGFVAKKEDLQSLGIVAYNQHKSLALFLYTGDKDSYPKSWECKCTSYLENGDPEVDDFEYVPLKEVSFYTVESLRKALYNTLKQFYPDEIADQVLDRRTAKINYKFSK